MELYSVFVTGANRGIGLELVRQLAHLPKPPKYIFATYRSRDGTEALKGIKDASKESQVLLIKMDVTKSNEIESARKITEDMVGERGLTLLINNAGVSAEQCFPQVTEENLLYHFKANTIGPVMVIQEFLPLLQKAAALRKKDSKMEVSRAAILNISSALGTCSNINDYNGGCHYPGYFSSKAALNMMGRVIAANVKEQGILLILMCPGWVKTDMGTEQAELDVDVSVKNMLNTLATLNESHHGQFMDRNGKPCPF